MYLPMRSKIIWMVSVILITAFLSGCARQSAATESAGTGVVTESTLVDTVDSSGQVSANQLETLPWNTSGIISTVFIKTNQTVKSGDVLMELDSTTAPANVIQGIVDLVNTKLALETAKSNKSTAEAAVALANAQTAYDSAMGQYYTLNIPQGSKESISFTEAKLKVAELTLKQVSDRLTDYSNLPEDDLFKAQLEQSVIQAQIDVNNLKRTLNYYYSTPDTTDVSSINADLELAKANLENAQREYDRVKDGPNPDDITVAQARVDAAQANVNSLKIIAPFDGEIVFVYTQKGDQVSTNEPAVILVNRQKLYVDVSIDETSISNIKVGDPAEISFDAFDGLDTTGKVTMINPIGSPTSGVVNFTVRVELDKADPAILIGSTASVTIQTSEPQSVLFVPVSAVQSDAQGEYVVRVNKTGVERVTVISGQIIDSTVVVKGDLKAGDFVQLYSSSSTSSDKNPVKIPGAGLMK